MRIFDPHIHMTSRTTDDYEALYAAGVRALVEPAFWLGQPRTNVGSFLDYFDALLGWERFRAAQFGIRHHATIALNPKEANDARCREVLDEIPRYLLKDGVVAVGEVGYDSMTPEEDEVFSRQLQMARDAALPCSCTPPPRQAVGDAADARRRARVGDRARARARGPPQRDQRRARARRGRVGRVLDLPGHEDGRGPHGRDPPGARHRAHDRELRRRLGPLRPAQDAQDGAGDARRGLHRGRRRPGAVAQPGRVLRAVGQPRAGPGPRLRRGDLPTPGVEFEGSSVLRGARA